MNTPDVLPITPEPAPAPRRPFNEVSVLFPLLAFYTAAYLGLTVADFALRQALAVPEGMMTLYVALLGAYAADKEIRRWLGVPEPPRKGTIFVYLWLLLFLTFSLIHTFQPDLAMPRHLLPVCLQVLGIFFGSKASKYVHENRGSHAVTDAGREGLILTLITAKGQVTRQMVEAELQITRSSAGRMLGDLEARGLIVRRGVGKGAYYVLPPPPMPPAAK